MRGYQIYLVIILQLIRKYRDEYYLVKTPHLHRKLRFTDLILEEKLLNLAHIYSKMILISYVYEYLFEFNLSEIKSRISDLNVDYFELIMVYMKKENINKYRKHIMLIKLWIKI